MSQSLLARLRAREQALAKANARIFELEKQLAEAQAALHAERTKKHDRDH
jgi:hypothetical protein